MVPPSGPSTNRMRWFLERSAGKAAIARYLDTGGPLVSEVQWWERRVQARQSGAFGGDTAETSQHRAPRRGERLPRMKGVRKPARAVRRAVGQRRLHLVAESGVAGTLLTRQVYLLVNPVCGPDGACALPGFRRVPPS